MNTNHTIIHLPIPDDEKGRKITVAGGRTGLEIQDAVIVPWEWIDAMRAKFCPGAPDTQNP